MLMWENVNCIAVEWKKGVKTQYAQAANNARVVDAQVAFMINFLMVNAKWQILYTSVWETVFAFSPTHKWEDLYDLKVCVLSTAMLYTTLLTMATTITTNVNKNWRYQPHTDRI